MSADPWNVDFPERLNVEFAHLSAGERRAIYDLIKRLADDPRHGTEEPISGAELRRAMTDPAADSGDRITVLYRVHDDERRLTLIWIVAGP
ncbi:hypothetical protein ABZ851_36785 [Streptomyces sp. NPDC047049]|uniref:type II toxin-antitoxin system RelE family toxin n=1 Tax=Streptomyces sp. NPDC047049 TaxID=3156688 RepID=UPI0033C7DCAC